MSGTADARIGEQNEAGVAGDIEGGGHGRRRRTSDQPAQAAEGGDDLRAVPALPDDRDEHRTGTTRERAGVGLGPGELRHAGAAGRRHHDHELRAAQPGVIHGPAGYVDRVEAADDRGGLRQEIVSSGCPRGGEGAQLPYYRHGQEQVENAEHPDDRHGGG